MWSLPYALIGHILTLSYELVAMKLLPLTVSLLLALGCGGQATPSPATPSPSPQSVRLDYRFVGEENGWWGNYLSAVLDSRDDVSFESGFVEEFNEDGLSGLLLSGRRTDGELFMYIWRELTPADGLIPQAAYRVSYRMAFYSDLPSGCPDELSAAWLKAGASDIEPIPYVDPDLLGAPLDKGQGSQSGRALSVVADGLENGLDCRSDGATRPLARLLRVHELEPVWTNENGQLWLVVGVESDISEHIMLVFERIEVSLEPLD